MQTPRSWGPAQQQAVFAAAELGQRAKLFAVLREPFKDEAAPLRAASEIVRAINDTTVAIATSATNHRSQVLASLFSWDDAGGSWKPKRHGVPLSELLHGLGHTMHLVPDEMMHAGEEYFAHMLNPCSQSTNEFVMVSPTAFEFNAEAAQDNEFMSPPSGGSLKAKVLDEFADLYDVLAHNAGLNIHLFEHNAGHGTPDACFPNNWFSTHGAAEAKGAVDTLVTYPMAVATRRGERRADILDYLEGLGRYKRQVDMTGHESAEVGRFLEGTGVLVLDRVRGVAYVTLGKRCDEELAREWVDKLGYKELVAFHATDAAGNPIYHTNVMMCVGSGVAIICSESIEDPGERQHVLAKLRASHEVVEITRAQMGAFCGNALEVVNGRGVPGLAMSTRAHNAFTEEQRAVMLKHVAELYHAPIDTLEDLGGGGVRCCLAEVF